MRRLMALELFLRTYGVPIEVQWIMNNPDGDIYEKGRGIRITDTYWIWIADCSSGINIANPKRVEVTADFRVRLQELVV